MSKKVVVGLSGGVDSSVAAWLLLEQGYQVEGLFMKNWEHDDSTGFCAAAQDLADAQHVASQLGIVLHYVNFSKVYWQSVFSHFLNDYEAGRTPNPDVLCNKEIKFNAFLTHAKALGADYIATGHYAKLDAGNLYKAQDCDKDQTYFLHAVAKDALTKTLFPLGHYQKKAVRTKAQQLGLITHDKKDSTGICFIGEKRFKTFLNEFILAKPGDIYSTEGCLLGQHDGVMFYTLGQRQGLHIGGRHDATDKPWYVVDKDCVKNNLIVAQGITHPMLYSRGLRCSSIHWLTAKTPSLPYACYAKTRYRQLDQACLISPAKDNQHCVMFNTPQRAVTPGQYVVFYDKDHCLGGAVIQEIIR
jgi:tRNA-specific 2-thiouridylase